MSQEAARLRRAGRDIVSLLEGEPDLPLPSGIAGATVAAIRAGRTRYSVATGLPELKGLLARKLSRRNGISVSPDQILITNGAKQAIYETLLAVCEPGDEVLIPSPCWVTFPEAVKLAGAKPVFVEMPKHALDVARLSAAVTRRSKVVIINSPNNPTGAVYPERALRELLRLAVRRNLIVVSDEAYEDFVYDGASHVSIASLPGAAKRTVTIGTFSKTFSMTGFRVGYLAGDPEFVRAAGCIHGHVTGNVCTFAQWGAVAALGLAPAIITQRRAALQRRRDLAHSLASRSFDCAKPQGALFLFADVRRHLGGRHEDSAALARFLLHKAGVVVVPGSACGQEGYLRISFSGSERTLREGFARIEEALRK